MAIDYKLVEEKYGAKTAEAVRRMDHYLSRYSNTNESEKEIFMSGHHNLKIYKLVEEKNKKADMTKEGIKEVIRKVFGMPDPANDVVNSNDGGYLIRIAKEGKFWEKIEFNLTSAERFEDMEFGDFTEMLAELCILFPAELEILLREMERRTQ